MVFIQAYIEASSLREANTAAVPAHTMMNPYMRPAGPPLNASSIIKPSCTAAIGGILFKAKLKETSM